jgi:uncharacterized protein (TIRG00374 family)
MKQKIFNLVKLVLKIGFSVGVIVWMVQSGAIDLSTFKIFLSPKYLIPGFIFIFINIMLCVERWRQLLLAQKIELSLLETAKLSFMGLFFNYIVPGGVGGDVIKGFYIVRGNPYRKMGAAVSVLMDRVLGLYAMILIALVCLLIDQNPAHQSSEIAHLRQALLMVFVVFSISLAFAFSKKIRASGVETFLRKLPLGEKLVRGYDAAHSFGENPWVIFYSIFLSIVAQTFSIFIFILAGYAMNLPDVPFAAYFFVVPIGFIATAVPISPAGVGVGQVAFMFLFNTYLGYKTSLGATAITIIQVLQFVFGLVGAWFFIRRKESMKEIQAL